MVTSDNEERRAQAADQAGRSPVDAEHGLHCVDQSMQRADAVRWEHHEDGEDRDRVHQRLADAGARDGHGDVAPRIHHLLRGRRRQLDADERVQQHRHDGDEHREGRSHVVHGQAVDPVLNAVRDDRRGEERQQDDLPDRSAGGHHFP
jgi:hypothetical protein